MLGTIVNVIAIIIGSIFGNLVKTGLPERVKTTIMQGFSLTVMLIGLSMAIKTQNILTLALSILIGGIIGELLRIEDGLDHLGQYISKRLGGSSSTFSQGFVTASLVYCVGAMAIMGAIESGLTGHHTILYTKSLLDGVSSVIFASTMGIGVVFSAIPVFIYQGAITLGAVLIKPLLTAAIIREMTATGGLLIFGIGFNLLLDKLHIKVGNLLPAILVAIPLTIFFAHVHF